MMATPHFSIDSAMKAQQWERAKGELRALVSLQGSYHSGCEGDQWEKYRELSERTEKFIEEVEDDALQE